MTTNARLRAFVELADTGSVRAAARRLVVTESSVSSAVGLLAAFGVAVLPRAIPDGGVAASGPVLRVLTANLRLGRASPPELVRLVRGLRPDVLSLQELTGQAVAALRAAGLEELLPYRVAVAPRATATAASAVPTGSQARGGGRSGVETCACSRTGVVTRARYRSFGHATTGRASHVPGSGPDHAAGGPSIPRGIRRCAGIGRC